MGKERKGLCRDTQVAVCSGTVVAAVWSMWREEWPEMKLDADWFVELLSFTLSSGFRLSTGSPAGLGSEK